MIVASAPEISATSPGDRAHTVVGFRGWLLSTGYRPRGARWWGSSLAVGEDVQQLAPVLLYLSVLRNDVLRHGTFGYRLIVHARVIRRIVKSTDNYASIRLVDSQRHVMLRHPRGPLACAPDCRHTGR